MKLRIVIAMINVCYLINILLCVAIISALLHEENSDVLKKVYWSSVWVTGWKMKMVITIVVVDCSLLPRMLSSGYHGSIFCGQVDLESKETPHLANDLVVVMRGGADGG